MTDQKHETLHEIPEEITDQLTVRVNHDLQPRDNGMWIASVSVFKVIKILLTQLRAATANEQSMVEQTAHNRDQLALVVQQKDALSVANQKLREKGQALLDRIMTTGACQKYDVVNALHSEADALQKTIADTQEGKTGKTVIGKVVMVTGAGLASLIENCQHGPTKFCLLELQQLRASRAALEQAQAGKEPK